MRNAICKESLKTSNPTIMTPLSSLTPPTIEQGVNAMVDDVKQSACRTYAECEHCVRESPGKAILLAVAAGYCLHRLPVRSLLVAQVRLDGRSGAADARGLRGRETL